MGFGFLSFLMMSLTFSVTITFFDELIFYLQLEPIRRYIREISARHRHLCEIRIKFDDKIARAV